jgi:glycosyltransferase involved in cell wall biosynthesis
MFLRFLYRQFAAVTFVGQANRDYFRTLGVPDSRLFFAPHAVDAVRFNSGDANARQEAERLRAELGLQGKRILLFAGKFQPGKQPVELLRAFVALAPANAALLFVGDGPEKSTLESIAREHPGAPVRFLPFANQSEMPARYLLGDVFVLPSRGFYETWGLAINEAMHLGRPCLVSDRVGCQRDLVFDGVTGWVFRADDTAHLREKMAEAIAADPAQFRPAIAARIATYSYRQASTGLQEALSSLRATKPL